MKFNCVTTNKYLKIIVNVQLFFNLKQCGVHFYALINT